MKRHGIHSARTRLAGVALVLALSGGNALAQSAPPDYSALTARSAALTPAQQAQAKQLFATGFSIWQSGDFAAAELAFKQGLDIDPANALANYYYGDCLARRKDKAEAKDYLARAVAFGGDTVEAFKAKAELQAIFIVPTNLADMNEDEIATALTGTWKFDDGRGAFELVITTIHGNLVALTGKQPECLGDDINYTQGVIQENLLKIAGTTSCSHTATLEMSLSGPNTLSGTEHHHYLGDLPMSATKELPHSP